MNKEDLWLCAVNYAAPSGSSREDFIKMCLDKADGDITQALKIGVKNDGSYRLCNGTVSGPNSVKVELWGSLGSNKILVWGPETPWNKPPDLQISWREVFKFVKNGRKRYFQISMELTA